VYLAGQQAGGGMNRTYGEPVNVQARSDGRPTRFVWRSRLYSVRAICEHWVINREWWREPGGEPGQPELEFWRVQASLGPGMTAGVYELRRDAATGAWTMRLGLTRTKPCPASTTPCPPALRRARQHYAVPRRCSMYRTADRCTVW
jgi:hypothetical protein